MTEDIYVLPGLIREIVFSRIFEEFIKDLERTLDTEFEVTDGERTRLLKNVIMPMTVFVINDEPFYQFTFTDNPSNKDWRGKTLRFWLKGRYTIGVKEVNNRGGKT